MTHCRLRSETRIHRILIWIVSYHDDAPDPFGGELPSECRRGQSAIDRLAAGHRDGVVKQQFIGYIDLGRDRRTDRQHARMGVGAVAEIGENVRGFGKRRLTDPRCAFAAHLREGRG